ncbi:MAG TPA: hypothetical protein VIX89_08190 [Bryobacteraceae bacterium]
MMISIPFILGEECGIVQRDLGLDSAEIFRQSRFRVFWAVGALKYSNGVLVMKESSSEITSRLQDASDVIGIYDDFWMILAVRFLGSVGAAWNAPCTTASKSSTLYKPTPCSRQPSRSRPKLSPPLSSATEIAKRTQHFEQKGELRQFKVLLEAPSP